MPTIDDQIRVIDRAICRYLDNIDNSTRAVISQDILARLKNLVEHVMLKYYSPFGDIESGGVCPNRWTCESALPFQKLS